MRCQELREILDSYIGDELLVETNHEILRHLEDCPDCRAELAMRRDLRRRVSSAVRRSPESQIGVAFAARLQTNLRAAAFEPSVWEKLRGGEIFNFKFLTAIAAVLFIVALAGLIWLVNSRSSNENPTLAENNESNQIQTLPQAAESPIIKAVEAAWREIRQAAVGDHENCAVKFRLAEEPISLEEAAAKFGRYNKDLDKTVIAAVEQRPANKDSEKMRFVEAHSCIFGGRRFAHVVLKYHNRLVSILITDTDLPLDNSDNETPNNSTNGNETSVASFRVARQAIFVVSDLSAADNSAVANAISPAVCLHLERAEA